MSREINDNSNKNNNNNNYNSENVEKCQTNAATKLIANAAKSK